MKLAFSTLICPNGTAAELKSMCEGFGIDGVELRTGDETVPVLNGVNITDIASSFCLFGYDEDLLLKMKEVLVCMERAGIGAIRVFLGNFRRRHDDPARDIDYDGIVHMLRGLCDSTCCEIWVETHNEFATGHVLKKLMEDVGRSNVKIIWDVMHPYEDGEQPEETFGYIGKYIAHVHIKDGRKKNDPVWHDFEYTPLGKGDVPIKEIVALLESNGYNGYYSLEWESAWRSELKQLGWCVERILSEFKLYMAKPEKEIKV